MGRCRKIVLCIDLNTDFQHEKKRTSHANPLRLHSWFFQACRYTSSQFTHKVMSSLVYPLPRWLVSIFSSKMPFATYIAWIIVCLKENLSRRCSLVVMYDGV